MDLNIRVIYPSPFSRITVITNIVRYRDRSYHDGHTDEHGTQVRVLPTADHYQESLSF